MSGKTLKDLVAQSGPLSPGEAVSKILDVIDGLQEAHERGVIHRTSNQPIVFLNHRVVSSWAILDWPDLCNRNQT